MSTTDDTASLQLADYGSLLKRRWWLVSAGLLAGVLVGFAAMWVIPPTYEASANVLVQPTNLPGLAGNVTGGRTNDAVNLDTESQLVTSAAVADGARKLLKTSESASSLAERVTVSVPPNSSVLTITFAGDTPKEAAKGAHYFAESYLANRKDNAEKQAETQVSALTKQRKDLEKRLKKVSSQIAQLPSNSTDRQVASAEQSVLTNQIADIGSKLAPLEDLSVDPGRIITDAAPPDEPSQPVPVLFLISGAMLGLLAGLVIAVLRDRSDHTIRRARDVTKLLDLPVLADVDVPERDTSWTSLLPSKSGAAQEIRQLQHAVSGPQTDHPHVVLVAAASGGPAASLIAANLTAMLGRSGQRVALVCADLASASSAAMLGVHPGSGVAEVLLGERSVDYVVQQAPSNDHIHVITPGMRIGEIGDTLYTEKLRTIVTVLRDQFDYVVLEAPATTVTADAQAWAQFSDAAIVVVQRLRTLREDALDAVSQMERVGCEVLGLAVLPRHPKSQDRPEQATVAYGSVLHPVSPAVTEEGSAPEGASTTLRINTNRRPDDTDRINRLPSDPERASVGVPDGERDG